MIITCYNKTLPVSDVIRSGAWWRYTQDFLQHIFVTLTMWSAALCIYISSVFAAFHSHSFKFLCGQVTAELKHILFILLKQNWTTFKTLVVLHSTSDQTVMSHLSPTFTSDERFVGKLLDATDVMMAKSLHEIIVKQSLVVKSLLSFSYSSLLQLPLKIWL